jgi:hypothetical protein
MTNYHVTQYSVNQDFLNACTKGDIKKATTLLNSNTARFHPDNRILNQAVIEVYFINKINVMKYLLTSLNLSKKPDLNYKNNLLFRSIYADKDYDLLNYLIFDLKIEKTARIIEELERDPDPKVAAMFMLRELNSELVLNEDMKTKKTKL